MSTLPDITEDENLRGGGGCFGTRAGFQSDSLRGGRGEGEIQEGIGTASKARISTAPWQ